MLKKIGIGLVFMNVAVFSFYAGTRYEKPVKPNPILVTMELDKEQNVLVSVNRKKMDIKLITDKPKKVSFFVRS